MHLAKLVICIAVILSIPCSPWGPQKLNTIEGGPKVLFNATYPIVLTATKPLTAPPTSIGFGRPPPLTGL